MAEGRFLERAYELARQHRPHPNPRVGAVVVSPAGDVVGEGAHTVAGQPHAEVVALDGVDATGATVYVSLEPCSHHGRTPPCVDQLIGAGVGRVVIGATDPDDRVSGSGIRKLVEAGVEVDVRDDPAAEGLDPGYFKQRRTGMALVTLKYAMTVDGAVAAVDGSSRWISGDEARRDAHRLRSESDVVVVGSGTLGFDDPRLDVRLENYTGHQPRAAVIAGRSPFSEDRQIWARDPLIFTSRELVVPSGQVVMTDGGDHPDPTAVCSALGDMGLYDVLLEGGPTLAGSWWRAGVVERLVVYIGAKVGGGSGMSPLGGVFATFGDSTSMKLTDLTRLGEDLRFDYERE